MHSPLRRQLARRQSRSPTKTPRRLQQEPTRQATPEPRATWRSEDRDVHLTPQRAAPIPQRAWERKPRAGQKGKIVWKRPQHDLPANQLRSKRTSSTAGALVDKTNTTPQKVTKKARLDAKGGIPAAKGEALSKPLHWDRRSSGLIHKTPAHLVDANSEDDPRADQENIVVTSDKGQDLDAFVASTAVEVETNNREQDCEEVPSPRLPFTYGVPSSDDLSELLEHDQVATSAQDQPMPQSPPQPPILASQDDEEPGNPQACDDQDVVQPSNEILPTIERDVSAIDDLCDRETSEAKATTTAPQADTTSNSIGVSAPARDHELRSTEVSPVGKDMQDRLTNEPHASPETSHTSFAEDAQEDDGPPVDPVEDGVDEGVNVDESRSPVQPSSSVHNETNEDSQHVVGESPDQATEAAEEERMLVDSTRAEDFDIVPDLPKRFGDNASPGLDQKPQLSPVRLEPSTAFGTPLASKAAPPTPGSTTVKIALNDDESILHDFISRTKASKAARIAKRSSDSHKRESDLVKKALASPGRVGEGLLEVDSPSDGKGRGFGLDGGMSEDVVASPTMTLAPPASVIPDGEASQGTARTRRSKRKQPSQVEKAADRDNELQEGRPVPTPGPVTFSLRRRGDDGEKFALKKTEAQEWSMMTRSNTRRNKAGAMPVKAVLTRLRGGEITPEEAAAMYAGEGDIPDEQGKSTVRWNEQLVKFFEESMTSTKGLDEEVDVLSQLSGQNQSSTDAARPRAKRAKALGAMNGTPAKSKTGKIVLDDGGSEAPVPDESKTAAPKQSRDDRAKRTHYGASESQTEADKGPDTTEPAQRPSKQARRLPAPTVKAPGRADAAEDPAAEEEKKPVKKAGSRAATAAAQTRAVTQAEESKQGKASGLRSGLPTRRGMRSRT